MDSVWSGVVLTVGSGNVVHSGNRRLGILLELVGLYNRNRAHKPYLGHQDLIEGKNDEV